MTTRLDDAPQAPSLVGRLARCTYFSYGPAKRWTNHGPIYGGGQCENGGKGCRCLVPSDVALPFFKHRPDALQDQFFCGCAGWE